MGALLGRSTQAAQLTATLQDEWQRVRQSIVTRTGNNPRVLFVLSHSPSQVMVGGRNSSAEAMLRYAGARNAVQEFEGFKPLTPEAVIASNPDIVLFTDQGLRAIGIDSALKLPGLSQTPAGQKRRVIALEAMFMLGFGPRLPSAVAALNAAITKAMSA
jgi:iron complex transport system substrate-binding protein